MVRKILTDAGFIEGETFKEVRFITPPKSTYCIYLDSFTRRGADALNLIKDHSYTIEVYSYYSDPEAESKIEAVFDKLGIAYEKDERTWLQTEQLYQVVYRFDHVEK